MKREHVVISCAGMVSFFMALSFVFIVPGHVGSEAGPDQRNVIMGYSGNRIEAGAKAATISGGGQYGFPNRVTGDAGGIGGGAGNEAGSAATVGGGIGNTASGIRSTIGGGQENRATRDSSVIGGGFGNLAEGSHATVAGGMSNAASEVDAAVGGGSGNVASERHATVSGGSTNKASGFASSIGGGTYNKAGGTYSAVGGGISNTASGMESTVCGGAGNVASGEGAGIGGGMSNSATGSYCAIAGGRANEAGREVPGSKGFAYATVGGGMENVASGSFSTVPGGSHNVAAGDYSVAAGHRAKVEAGHDGVFLFADHHDKDFSSAAPNEFAVRGSGGVRFVTGTDTAGQPTAGVRIPPGGGAWETLSDKSSKTALSPVNGQEILERLEMLPIRIWSYRAEDPSVRHIGPTAQDFHEIFQLGKDERFISTVDADGIALAAVQGLLHKVKEKEATIQDQRDEIRKMKENISAQMRRMAALEERLKQIENAIPPALPSGH
jgi:trimeric autotransporter adhesin